MLHGVLGSGANWRTFARRLVAAAPSWGILLVDLRGHGMSQRAPPPHTLATAAGDLARLEGSLGTPVRAVMGHSFGGKVALAYLAQRTSPLDHVWILDASPAARPDERSETTRAVLRTLRRMPDPIPSRERFLEIVQHDGHGPEVADWLAMSVRQTPEGLRLRLDLDAIEAMLDDHFRSDLWSPVVDEHLARSVGFVLGGCSTAVPPEDRERMEELASSSPRITVHVLERAGHWLHVDDADGLLGVLGPSLG